MCNITQKLLQLVKVVLIGIFVHPESGDHIFFKPILGFIHSSALTLQFFLTWNPERHHIKYSTSPHLQTHQR